VVDSIMNVNSKRVVGDESPALSTRAVYALVFPPSASHAAYASAVVAGGCAHQLGLRSSGSTLGGGRYKVAHSSRTTTIPYKLVTLDLNSGDQNQNAKIIFERPAP
jgi:hypothetical protein